MVRCEAAEMIVADTEGAWHETTSKRDAKFIRDMERKGIKWVWYSGRFMYGKHCPSVNTTDDLSVEDIIRATAVKDLRRDRMGLGFVVYTG